MDSFQLMDQRKIREAMRRVMYHSDEWYSLCLLLAQALLREGKSDDAINYTAKLEKAKLPCELQRSYRTVLASIAEQKQDYEKMIEHLIMAKAADRLLDEPAQQFELTKQIVIVLDHLGRYPEAIKHWESLLEDFKNFKHAEHQPLLVSKFLVKLYVKLNDTENVAQVKARWVNERVEMRLGRSCAAYFKSSEPPENYDDELTNFFERARQNTFALYANEKSLVSGLNTRNAQFWAGADSMRDRLADLLEDREPQLLSNDEQLPYFFFMRSLSTYLTTVELAAGGRISEAFGAMRMCLENALYAFHLSQKPEHAALWLDRPTLALGEVDNAKKAKRTAIGTAFGPTKIINDIIAENASLGQACRYYYEMSIDEGAHPNVDIFRRQASQRTTTEAAYVFGVDFLNPMSSVECCKTILDASAIVLDVFRMAGWIW